MNLDELSIAFQFVIKEDYKDFIKIVVPSSFKEINISFLSFYLDKEVYPEYIKDEDFVSLWQDYISSKKDDIKREDLSLEFRSHDLIENLGETKEVSFLNNLLAKAISLKASDIHIEPYEQKVSIKLRLDGVLHNYKDIDQSFYQSILSRVKVMSNLNLAEKRVPQDGRFRLKLSDNFVDVRVSTLPSIFGERIVLRILDKANKVLSIEQLGLLEEDIKKVKSIISKPYGIVLVTGPTGSGKSTTLYAFLNELKKNPQKNIITVEDPVEYQIDGISQVQVNPKAGLTFASGLRSILRQDPDIIMVGEIRDKETADIAINAALTGHLVFSTLHTNDAISSITRLFDMEIEPFLISSSLEGLMSQRLVRKICDNCKEEYFPSEEELMSFPKDLLDKYKPKKFYKGKGCEKCMNTGYKGRIGIFEIILVDEQLKKEIIKNQDSNYLKTVIQYKTMLEDGLQKIINGTTTSSEVLGVCKT